MTADALTLPSAQLSAIGTTASVTLTEPDRLDHAETMLRTQLAELDRTCSRFLAGSETSRLARRRGQATPISPLLVTLLHAALRAAELTDGLVDPTVGQAMLDIGYDRDIDDLATRDAPWVTPHPAPGWRQVRLDRAAGRVVVPAGVHLDLGATAKAMAADRAADRLADELGCGVLVGIGGDVAVRGPAPAGGWLLRVGENHRPPEPGPDAAREPVIAIRDGAVATSSTTTRTWRRGGRRVHHIVDPRTGDVTAPAWRTVSVAAATCLDANTASTAAVVLGPAAPTWLHEHGLPALLIRDDGHPVAVAGWPEPSGAVTVRPGRSR